MRSDLSDPYGYEYTFPVEAKLGRFKNDWGLCRGARCPFCLRGNYVSLIGIDVLSPDCNVLTKENVSSYINFNRANPKFPFGLRHTCEHLGGIHNMGNMGKDEEGEVKFMVYFIFVSDTPPPGDKELSRFRYSLDIS